MVVKLPIGTDLDGMRAIGHAVASTIESMRCELRAGITTRELDMVGRHELARQGARSAPELVYQFPAATCISVNDEAAHGIPGDRQVCDGDLVNIDVSAELDGYYADAGASFPVGAATAAAQQLCDAAQEALHEALRAVRSGKLVNGVGRAVERVARERGFRVIRNLCGHGVGRSLHEDPRTLLNYYEPRDRRRFNEGMVLTVEPFLSASADRALEGDDGWTLRTADGSLAAQYEHTVVVTRKGVERLTAL
ncbi:MAG TPA: type I methionyl aminopeptidase [Acidobacteriota bacterium]|jgi:methionyl aminopeptidase|nr:type I methionyl aminopeptidase [Acidobacteriota bacterium]